MPKLNFIHPSGDLTTIDADDGISIMEAALDAGIDEILAECGGNATCATCHVYLDEADVDRFGPVSDLEDDMLEGTFAERRPTSRLSCQLTVCAETDGLTITLPEEQC